MLQRLSDGTVGVKRVRCCPDEVFAASWPFMCLQGFSERAGVEVPVVVCLDAKASTAPRRRPGLRSEVFPSIDSVCE